MIDESLPSTSGACDLRLSFRNRRPAVDRIQMFDEWATTPESDSDETDSDYNPTSKSRYHKSTSKKISKKNSRKNHVSKKKKSSNTQRKHKDRRDRSQSSSGQSDNESTKKEETASSRAKKRRISKSSDESSSKKLRKKSKKSKKSKSSKKSKKRSEKTNHSSDDTTSTSGDDSCSYTIDEEDNRCCKSERRRKSIEKLPEKSSHHPSRYSSDELHEPSEEPPINEVSLQQPDPTVCSSSCFVESSQPNLNSSRSAESDLSDYRVSTPPSMRRSSIDSLDSQTINMPSEGFLAEQDEDSHHTPPVSDEESRVQS